MKALNLEIAPLVYDNDTDSSAKIFDLLMFDLVLNLLNADKRQVAIMKRVQSSAKQLFTKKQSVPMVKSKAEILEALSKTEFWGDVTPEMVENIRVEIRDLMKFLDHPTRDLVISNFEDEILAVNESPAVYESKSFDKEAYKEKIEQYIKQNQFIQG